MKQILLAMLALTCTVSAVAQKEPPKPNVNKALTLAKQGKYDEAKAIVDGVPTHSKTMNDDKAWFYRGLVYIAMDTSSTYKGGENNVAIGAESLTKAIELAGPKGKLNIIDNATGETKTLEQLIGEFNYKFLLLGDKLYNSDKFTEAVSAFEKGLTLRPDTAIYRYAAYAAQQGGNIDQANKYIEKYIGEGGTNSLAYSLRVANLYESKKDYEGALVAARQALEKFPNDGTIRQIEFNCLIELKRYKEATENLLQSVKANPNDVDAIYLLGALYEEQKETALAKEYFTKCTKIDPKFVKAPLALARYGNNEFVKVKQEMDKLDFKKDKQKLLDLDKVYLEKLKEAAALWENCEKIAPNEREVLENLWRIYSPSQLDDKTKYAAIEKKMKINGFLD